MILLSVYVKDRARFFKRDIIPDIAAESAVQYVDDFSDEGRALGDSFLDKFINAEKNGQTWAGKLRARDFAVFDERLVSLKPLKSNASQEELRMDKAALVHYL